MLFFALTVCNTIYAKEHLANRSLILPLCVAFEEAFRCTNTLVTDSTIKTLSINGSSAEAEAEGRPQGVVFFTTELSCQIKCECWVGALVELV